MITDLPKPLKKALVCTNHLWTWGGSEMVAIELAEAFSDRGLEVMVFTNYFDEKFVKKALPERVIITDNPASVFLMDYDLVYCQHQLISLLLPQLLRNKSGISKIPLLVYGHLSPFEPMEFPSPFMERRVADVILCNSVETHKTYAVLGSPFTKAKTFPNPAPASFESIPREQKETPNSILIVSNHLPEEIVTAIKLFEMQGLNVTRIGHPVENRRILAKDIFSHDAVITIGKTTQFALRAHIPVFCYDQFGGPGWLGAENFESAAQFNFSGRSHPEKLDPEKIVQQFIAGFSSAAEFARNLPDETLNRFRLEEYIDQLLTQALNNQEDELRLKSLKTIFSDPVVASEIWHEEGLYNIVRREYREKMRARVAKLIPEAKIYWSEKIKDVTSGYSEARTATVWYSADGERQTLTLSFPGDLGPLVGLRLDIADGPTAIVLHGMRLIDSDGHEFWQWPGNTDAFARVSGVAFFREGDGEPHTLFALDDDPQFELVLPGEVLATIRPGCALLLDVMPCSLASQLPRLFAQASSPDHQAPAPPAAGLENIAELLHARLDKKNRLIASQKEQIQRLEKAQEQQHQQLLHAESQLALLKEFLVGNGRVKPL